MSDPDPPRDPGPDYYAPHPRVRLDRPLALVGHPGSGVAWALADVEVLIEAGDRHPSEVAATLLDALPRLLGVQSGDA